MYRTTGPLYAANLTAHRLAAVHFRTENVLLDNAHLRQGWAAREQSLLQTGRISPHQFPLRLLVDGYSSSFDVTDSFDGLHSSQATEKFLTNWLHFLACSCRELGLNH
eukprot:gb/GEZN01014169.1/.p1 GENE.gb/GEZN01014169.1/~~gb/GEZN01014169.1/.p1  ORF type:complete len:108 (-),score=9.26 gb/GEZN01014169.1/:73-396(-)